MELTSCCSCPDLYWHGCYGSGAKYNKYIIPESVKHPAKMSWDLLERIFKHLESLNLLTPDSVVIDFMSGTGRTNTMAALRGYRTISVELEPHFIEMVVGYDCDGRSIDDFRIKPCACGSDVLHKPHKIRTGLFEVECSGNPGIVPVCRCGDKSRHKEHHIAGNRELLEQVTGRKVKWDVIQGDARELSSLLDESGLVGVVSPPYFSQVAFQDKKFIISIAEDKSQRYRDGRLKGHFATPEAIQRYAEKIMETYSLDPRNIGNLPDTSLVGIMSPPYQDSLCSGKLSHEDAEKMAMAMYEKHGRTFSEKDLEHQIKLLQDRSGKGYSLDPNNIGNLKDVPLVGIMSPPYQDTAMPMGCPAHIRKLAREGDWDKAIELERKAEAEQVKKGNKFAVSTDETIRKKIEMALEMEKGNYSENPDNIGNLKDVPLVGIMSPPFLEAQTGGGIAIKGYEGKYYYDQGNPDRVGERCGYVKARQGTSEGQIGNLPDKPLVGITSPPYGLGGGGLGNDGRQTQVQKDKNIHLHYSESDTNIGNLPDRPLIGITSPPYVIDNKNVCHTREGKTLAEYDVRRGFKPTAHQTTDYSTNPQNIGNQPDESYLSAMLKVYQQAFICGISPLVVVTKNPTRNGKLRRLDSDTVYLLQLAGYEIFDYHRAVLFESHKQETLSGDTKDVHKGRISFFKRLSLEKGTTVAQWEDIIFARIP